MAEHQPVSASEPGHTKHVPNKQNESHYMAILLTLARSLYRSLLTAPKPLSDLQNVLALTVVAFETAETASLASDYIHEDVAVEKELQGCDQTLLALRRLVRLYGGYSHSQEQKDLTREAADELVEIRERLTTYTNSLNQLNMTAIRASQDHVAKTMTTFIEQIRSGKRENSVISTQTLSIDNKEAWKQLRRELQDAGINGESFARNLDLIIVILKETEFGGRFSDTDGVTPEMITVTYDRISYEQVKDMADLATNVASTWVGTLTDYAYSSQWKVLPGQMGNMFSKAIGNRKDFVSCAEDGDVTSVLYHLKRGANINATSAGESALSRAAANGHKEIVLLLFAKGADLDAVNPEGESAFVQAAKNGRKEVVEILLSHATSVAEGRAGENALKQAAKEGHEEIVRMLLDHGINPDTLDPNDQKDNTALSNAAGRGHEKIVLMLLDRKVRINTVNYWGETALYHAIAYGDKSIIHHLLKLGVDIDPRAEHRAQENARLFSWLKAEQRAREKGLLDSSSTPTTSAVPKDSEGGSP